MTLSSREWPALTQMSPEESAVISPLVLTRQCLPSQHATALPIEHGLGGTRHVYSLAACGSQAQEVGSITTLIRQRPEWSPRGTSHPAAMWGGSHRLLERPLGRGKGKGDRELGRKAGSKKVKDEK